MSRRSPDGKSLKHCSAGTIEQVSNLKDRSSRGRSFRTARELATGCVGSPRPQCLRWRRRRRQLRTGAGCERSAAAGHAIGPADRAERLRRRPAHTRGLLFRSAAERTRLCRRRCTEERRRRCCRRRTRSRCTSCAPTTGARRSRGRSSSAQNEPQYFRPGRDQRRSALLRIRPRSPGRPDVLRAGARLQVRVSRSRGREPACSCGPAGKLNRRPLTAAELRELSEYLWQFTQYNNVGYAVLASSGSSSAAALTHTLHIGSPRARCDVEQLRSVDVISWRHTLDTTTGSLQLEVKTLWSFGAREAAGVVSLCSV